MSESHLPKENPRSKREQIHELLLRGYSTKEIAEVIPTTPANIWKEKSILKARGLGTHPRSGVLSSSVPSTPGHAGQNDRPKEHFKAVWTATPDFQELYKLFEEGKKPIYLILHYNFHPELVEKEYDRFLKFRSMDSEEARIT